MISIPKASNTAHVRENAGTADIVLTAEDRATINAMHRPPVRKVALDFL